MKTFLRNVIGVPESEIFESKEPTWNQINRDKDEIEKRYYEAEHRRTKLLVFVYMSCHGKMFDKLWLVLNEGNFYKRHFRIEEWLTLWSETFDNTYTVAIADCCRAPWQKPVDYEQK